MNDDALIASALLNFSPAREFQRLFPNAEHTIVGAMRDFDPDGWRAVSEWISRARLYDRYILWLVVAVEVGAGGSISEFEKPEHYLVEVEKVNKSVEGDALWECNVMEFEADGCEQLVQAGGDLTAIADDLTIDVPVEGFDKCWNDTRPRRDAAHDSSSLKAPLRYMS